jgi:hypothetical protein
MGNASNVISESMAHDLMMITGIEESFEDNADYLLKRNVKDRSDAIHRVGNVVSDLSVKQLVDEFYSKFYSKNSVLWDEAIKECQRKCIVESDTTEVSNVIGKPKEYAATVAQPFTKEIIKELNKVRVDPAEYASSLGTFYDRFVDNFVYATADGQLVRTNEGRELVRETVAFLRNCPPAPPPDLIAHAGAGRSGPRKRHRPQQLDRSHRQRLQHG